MRKQLDAFNFSFDWKVAFETCDPKYYRWTQFIFLKLVEAGLAYQKRAWVNWDPVDKTVLANEQIDSDGRSWRSGAVVERRLMRQWFIRTTEYTQALLDGLADVEPRWRDEIVAVQRNWLGKCDGRRIYFGLDYGYLQQQQHNSAARPLLTQQLEIFTRRIEGLYGAAFIALKPSHVLVKELIDAGLVDSAKLDAALNNKSRDGKTLQQQAKRRKLSNQKKLYSFDVDDDDGSDNMYELPVHAVNPLRARADMPIFVVPNNSPLFQSPRAEDAELDAHIGMPSFDQDDMLFVRQHQVPARDILDVRGERIIASGEFSGMPLLEAREAIGVMLERMQRASSMASANLEDWLISRQRFWGTPIPIIHCPQCREAVSVPVEQLPVCLPDSSATRKSSAENNVGSPLEMYDDFVRCKCPKCGSPDARRETDTMDTFFDSSWYYLRYPDHTNQQAPFDAAVAKRIMPVDLYIGGREHALMHLYYARFMSHFLHKELKFVPCAEPFANLLVQGFVMGKSYKGLKSGRYYEANAVEPIEVQPSEVDSLDADMLRLYKQQVQQRVSVTKSQNQQQQQRSSGAESAEQQLAAAAPITLHRTRATTTEHAGEPVLAQWEKMSKSRRNGTDPQQALDEYGIDSTRLYMLANISPRTPRNWDPSLFAGSLKFEMRLWQLVGGLIDHYNTDWNPLEAANSPTTEQNAAATAASERLWDARNYYTLGITYQLEHYFALSTAISKLQGLLGDIRKESVLVSRNTREYERALGALIVMLYPFSPHFAAELWTGLCAAARQKQLVRLGGEAAVFQGQVWEQPWPQIDADYGMKLNVQIFDTKVDTLRIPYAEFNNLTHERALEMAFSSSDVLSKYIERETSAAAFQNQRTDNTATATLENANNTEQKQLNFLVVDGVKSSFNIFEDKEAILTFYDGEARRKFKSDKKAAKEQRAHKRAEAAAA